MSIMKFVYKNRDFSSHLDVWNYPLDMNLDKFTYKA